MNRRGHVFYDRSRFVGVIEENEEGYVFTYNREYLSLPGAIPISQAMPLRAEPYASKTMIPFFDGLIPEGWLLEMVEKSWKIDPRDRMGLLLTCCEDCIGAISVIDAAAEKAPGVS